MTFVALKPCCFGGFSFRIGENVPDRLVAPSRVRWFIMNGYLAETSEMEEIINLKSAKPETDESQIMEQKSGEKSHESKAKAEAQNGDV